MRLFIAIQFPKPVKAALVQTMEDLQRQGVSGNFSRVENLHLTLAFLGEVESYEGVCRVMDQVKAQPFLLTLGESGSFGDLYWIGIKPCLQLENYVKRLRKKLSEEGIGYNSKAFKAHITLIRKAKHTDGIKFLLPKESFWVTKIALMKSEILDGKLTYTELYSTHLGSVS